MDNKEIKGPDFLVIGLQKCGTYWITGLLNNHPEINCVPSLPQGQDGILEGHIFDNLKSIDDDGGKHFCEVFSRVHNGFFSDLVPMLEKLPRHKFYDLMKERYIAYCNQFRTKRLFGEKTTEYVWCLDIIDYFFSDIKKLCILRDVKDRIVSWHFHQVRKKRIPEAQAETVSDELIADYCKRVKREYGSLLLYHNNIHCFSYEDMKHEPKKVVKEILSYLDADVSEEIINELIEKASFGSLTKVSKVGGDYERKVGQELRTSHFRKGVVGDWKNYLKEYQLVYIREQLKELQDKINQKFGFNLEI
ncbi:hypothetical protein HOG16_00840 [Candidatus Woesearchaeota archaeon]|nr:hypothetical protein [Candidatus Woesearchaeota archaeon]MBT4322101.1 hypothetical protein [Candidatus Woesearchaeota archaeon]MBT4630678.1 hypothetical protein [Candidatus Woesearchaeota archaeon]